MASRTTGGEILSPLCTVKYALERIHVNFFLKTVSKYPLLSIFTVRGVHGAPLEPSSPGSATESHYLFVVACKAYDTLG